MAMRILWPNLPAEFHQIADDAVGPGFETDFCASAAEVSDEQWANADAIVGSCPPQYIDKLRQCRIFVKYGVGYDDVDIERFGKLGIPVCNTPDYGTREVADHAHRPDDDAGQEYRLSRRRAARRPARQLAPCPQPVRPAAVGLHLRRGRHGPHRHRRRAPRQGFRHGCRLLRSVPAERLSIRHRRPPRRHAGRADGPVRFRQHPRATQRGDAQPDRGGRLRRGQTRA